MDEKLIRIYNAYQKAVNTELGRPFKYRKDFSGFEDEKPEVYSALLNLSRKFDSFSGIDPDKFFRAPYRIRKETECIPITEYTEMSYIKMYREYIDISKHTDDDAVWCGVVKDGFRAIAERCVRENIKLSEYIGGVSENAIMLRWVEDYKSNRIDISIVYGIFLSVGGEMFSKLLGMCSSVPELVSDVLNDLSAYCKNDVSAERKAFLVGGMKKLSEIIKMRINSVDTSDAV